MAIGEFGLSARAATRAVLLYFCYATVLMIALLVVSLKITGNQSPYYYLYFQ